MFVATLLGNSLWLLALSYYIYITFLGYSSLNMLTRSVKKTVNRNVHLPIQDPLLPGPADCAGGPFHTDPLSELEPQQQSDVFLQISSSLDLSD